MCDGIVDEIVNIIELALTAWQRRWYSRELQLRSGFGQSHALHKKKKRTNDAFGFRAKKNEN